MQQSGTCIWRSTSTRKPSSFNLKISRNGEFTTSLETFTQNQSSCDITLTKVMRQIGGNRFHQGNNNCLKIIIRVPIRNPSQTFYYSCQKFYTHMHICLLVFSLKRPAIKTTTWFFQDITALTIIVRKVHA